MRILILTTRYFPHIGGVETVVDNLANEFVKSDNEVAILTSKVSNSLVDVENKLEVVNRIKIKRIWMAIPRSISGFLIFPIRFILSLIKINKFLKQFTPEVVNVHFLDDIAIYTWCLSLMNKNLPIIVNIHGNDLHIFNKKWAYKYFIKSILNNCKKIIVNSSYMKNEVLAVFPNLEQKLEVIPNGLNIDKIREIEPKSYFDKDYIFFVGRFVYKKGIDILIKAFAKANILDLNLLVEGHGETYDEITRLATNLNLQDKIVFTKGNLTNEEKIAYMKGSIFGVMPSRVEPFGIVALEFMAAGVPLIASRTGGLEDILRNGSGLFFENENVDDLAEKISYLYINNEARDKMIKSQHMDIVHYTWHNISKEYIKNFLLK